MQLSYNLTIEGVDYTYVNNNLFQYTAILDIAAKQKNATNEKIIVALKYCNTIELVSLDMIAKLVVLLLASKEDRIINLMTLEGSILIDTRLIEIQELLNEFNIIVENSISI